MTIASETSRVDLVGDGVNDTFTFTFEVYVKTDLLVYVDETLQVVDVNYTMPDESIENPDGGDIVFGAEYIPALDAIISIILNLPYTQLIDYVEADKFPAETHERGLDRLVKIAQQAKERLARQPSLLESSQYSDLTLPDPVASKLLAWKDDLSGIKNVEVESEGDLLVTDFIKTLIDDEDAVAALATLGLTVTDFIKTLLDDADAGTAQSTLGISAFIKTLLDDADAAAFLTTLEIDTDITTLSLPANVTISAFVKTLLDDVDAAAARATLGGIKTGTYTGDGTTRQAITGVGFQVVMVWIIPYTESASIEIETYSKITGMYSDRCLMMALNDHEICDNRIISLDADGFTVDDEAGDYNPNKDGTPYHYIAWG